MKYNDIVKRVAVNLGIDSPSASHEAVIRDDISFTMKRILRMNETLRKHRTYQVQANDSKLVMPEDTFLPHEVSFVSSTNGLLSKSELTNEEFEKLKDLDGDAGMLYYSFYPKEGDLLELQYSPAFIGRIKVFYSYVPVEELNRYSHNPKIKTAFTDLLVFGGTIQGLIRKQANLPADATEIQYVGIRSSLKKYEDMYSKAFSDYGVLSKPRAESAIILPDGLLNDTDMIVE
jgi:hypothetical protein